MKRGGGVTGEDSEGQARDGEGPCPYPSTTLRVVPLPTGYAAGEADSPLTFPTVRICGSTTASRPGAYQR